MKTIVALSTPQLKSAIHIIRISGDDAFAIVQKISKQKITKVGYQIQKVDLYDGKQKIDEVLLNKFVCPKSYTGEDLIEINCHGSLYVANKIISSLIKNGCQLAKNGEFTKRAFINNKISLIQSEAINNLINSSNDIALNAALNGLDNNSNLQLQKIRDDIFKILGQTEVDIDYPEYESTPDVTKKEIANIFNNTIKVIKQIITDSSQVITIKDGINIAIIGKPNVGKSSLLNALLKEDKAIVSNIPGTTRDAIESSCVINGIKFNFVDTAGIRDTKNKIEKIGVDKALKVSQEANLILFVIDNSKKITNKDKKIINSLKGKNYQIILNKSDKKQLNDIKGLKISAKNNEIKPLIKYLSNYINIEKINLPNKLILQNQLSIDLLKNVLDNIVEAQKIYKQDSMLEMVCPLLSNSIELIEKIVGNPNDLSFIDELFSKFCVGK